MALFVTAFDVGFWIKGLTVIRSFQNLKSAQDSMLVLCLDAETKRFFTQHYSHLAEFAMHSDVLPLEVQALKEKRNPTEYACTIKSFLLLFGTEKIQPGEWAFWVDADGEFYSDPSLIYQEVKKSVFLSKHRFSEEFAMAERSVGSFNGGLIGFRNDEVGRGALHWWADQCFADCPVTVSEGKYLDQKYLDQIPLLFPAHLDENTGVNAAPWNVTGNTLVKMSGEQIGLNEFPLVFFHYQGLKIIGKNIIDYYGGYWCVPAAFKTIYARHARSLKKSLLDLEKKGSISARNFQKVPKKILFARLLGIKKGSSNLRFFSA